MNDLSELHDTALDYELGVIASAETVTEYRIKMYEKKDAEILKSIIPVLENLIYEANQYKDWLEEI